MNAQLAFLGTDLNVKMLMNVRNIMFVDVMAAPLRTPGVVMDAVARETFCIQGSKIFVLKKVDQYLASSLSLCS